jgi:D-alanyl-D-alanine carboxypeptidase (penicillin-binding protein 5/6)
VSSRFRGCAACLSAALALATAACSYAAPQQARAAGPARQPAAGATPRPARQAVGGAELAGTGVVVNYPARGALRLPRIPASAYVIADAGTGQVLAAKDAHGEFAPASTLKVLTAIALIPQLSPDALVLASKQAVTVEPNVVGLIAGHRYKVADLFRALLLISANDAAVALTQATGSFGRGMALINAEAHRLQAYDVVAKQPNGLPAPGQYVSAYDEALIARQALTMPAFMKYDSTLAARFEVKARKWVTLVNQNSLLTRYKGALGGKIGWTVSSKATYIGMARRGGVTLIVTVLHCAPLQEVIAGERLLNWGFAMTGQVKPVGVLVPPLQAVAAQGGHGGQPGHPASQPARQASQRLAAGQPAADAKLTSGQDDSGSLPAGLIAVIAGFAVAAAAAIARLAWSRRRSPRPASPAR